MQPDLEHDAPMVSSGSFNAVRNDVLPLDNEYFPWYVRPSTETAISPFYLCWHKAMDIAFAFCALLMLLLILPVLVVLIYLDSPGPIFYVQERVGYQRRKFQMYKFRSMYTNTGHLVWATRGDTRVTRVGRFLRATHLDELPQVFNILRDEMSLIGPRPELEDFVVELEKADPLYRCRLTVKPGITGWAQVQYGYGSTSEDELVKLKFDIYYIEHRSFMLDIRIILKTVVEVGLCHGT